MRMLRLLLGVMALAPTCAVAGEPTGFEGFAFGTTRSVLVVVNHASAPAVNPAPVDADRRLAYRTIAGHVSDLRSDRLGTIRVAFLFSTEDRLIGILMYIARTTRSKCVQDRDLIRPPTRQWEEGRTIAWLWPSGTEASLTSFCRGTDGLPYRERKGADQNAAPEKR